jgi:curved DNA-binding protein CbpA
VRIAASALRFGHIDGCTGRFNELPNKVTLDHYQVLEVSADADAKTIDAAYCRLARESATGTRRALADLNVAYELLGTPTLRQQYDAGRLPQPRAESTLRPVSKVRTPEERLPEASPLARPHSRSPERLQALPVDPHTASQAPEVQHAYVDLLQLQVRQSRASLRVRLASLPASAEDAGRSPLQRIFGRVRAAS